MWKYKDTGIFSIGNCALLILTLVIGILAGSLIKQMQPENTAWSVSAITYAIPLVLPFAVILIGFRLFRSLKDEDTDAIAKAVPPDWQKIPADSEILSAMQNHCRSRFIALLICSVLPLGIFMLLFFFFANIRQPLFVCGGILLLTVLDIVHSGMRWMFWRHIPPEMEYAAIRVAYHLPDQQPADKKRYRNVQLYFFLPDGRYRVVVHALPAHAAPPDMIYFVRLYGFVRWIHWHVF